MAVLLGALFLLLAAVGLIRMPDVYNRMQAGTKATTLGSMLVFVGFMVLMPSGWTRLLLLVLFIFLTNPLSSHALARAAHAAGHSPLLPNPSTRGTSGTHGAQTGRDDLAAHRADSASGYSQGGGA